MRNVVLLLLGVVVGIAIVVGGLLALPFVSQRASRSTLVQAAPAPTIASQIAATPTPAPPTPQERTANPSTPAPTVTTAPTPTAAATAVATGGTARLLADEAAIVELYERVSPAVVNITNQRGQAGGTDFARGAGSG